MKIISSGFPFIDIDAYACIYAYKELLELQGVKCQAIISSTLNSSITKKYQKLDFHYKNTEHLKIETELEFIVMDTSAPEHFERFIQVDKVSKIFDHHPGYEKHWEEKLGKDSVIEEIGAAATLIFREFKKNNLLNKISQTSAELLALAILSNNLNFKAKISKPEDKQAYQKLLKILGNPKNFSDNYFLEVQNSIESNLEESLKNDSKKTSSKVFIAQLEVWDSHNLLKNKREKIDNFLTQNASEICFLNLIDLQESNNILGY